MKKSKLNGWFDDFLGLSILAIALVSSPVTLAQDEQAASGDVEKLQLQVLVLKEIRLTLHL